MRVTILAYRYGRLPAAQGDLAALAVMAMCLVQSTELAAFITTLKRRPAAFLVMDESDLRDEFLEEYKEERVDDLLGELSATDHELRDVISYLINYRELLRDAQLEKLEEETQHLVDQLEEKKRVMLLEELRCFKDVLALHRHLLGKNDEQGH